MSELPPSVFLAAMTWLHVGFQMTVTAVVYPAFARVPVDHWPGHHRSHSRRMGPVVLIVYGALLTSSAWAILSNPVAGVSTWIAVLAVVATVLVTALAAAPLHGRLGRSRERRALTWLFAADRVRLLLAIVAACAATWALLGDPAS